MNRITQEKDITSNRIFLCGCFDFDNGNHGGQPVKSRETYWALQSLYGSDHIQYLETKDWKRHPFRLLIQFMNGAHTHDCLIMLPANNGLRIFSRLLLFSKKTMRKKIYYDVIGGWLPEFLSDKRRLMKILKRFDGLWVETGIMKERLENLGFRNISVLPNFKSLHILNEEELIYPDGIPLRLCTFSRVVPEKGIEAAVEAVKFVNEKMGYTACSLDIYGGYTPGNKEWFCRLEKDFPSYIRYKGEAEPSKSVEILKDYFALLFPTHFYTEGIPGTIVDAYSAGVPVVSARWESFDDVVDDGETGCGYEFDNQEEFERLLYEQVSEPLKLLKMRRNCIKKAQCFSLQSGKNLISEKLYEGGACMT